MVVNKRKRQLKNLRESLYMEEKNRAKAINAKFDKDIKAAAVGYEAQISVLNAQSNECLTFNTACIESRREFRKLISPSRGPLLGRRQYPR